MVDWETSEFDGVELLDFTTITRQPYVWGQDPDGYIQDRQVFRRGICTIQRQIFAPTEDGYEIVAEGESQTICFIQTTFNCETGPTDPFRYHTDSAVCDSVEGIVTCGSRFTDPDIEDDDMVVFADVLPNGQVVYDWHKQMFQFVDVWDPQELVSVCEPGTGTI